MGAISQLLTAFGLSASAGLNAYIPLLTIALMARFTDWFKLSPPFDLLANEWVIAVIAVLLAVETLADKVPGIDHLNDLIQTAVRPAAGAILFAANTNVVTGVHPVLALIAGLIVAGAVHVTKAAARPVVNVSTLGIGGPIVSVVEDAVSFLTTLVAVFMPALLIFFLAAFVVVVYRVMSRRSPARTA